ncbi:MotA/TolQ/ExbB proton channel family protein [Shewanella sp. NIFS-20-20]|uniref:MotA/TolQ/ExbB proton channel family protein n=1 Tax=Shewanella sp. NIFS-20-20 TaxID=2853806 RepID=UPI001C44940A|nr:MotA/TolQ/ExbB proton channel family protein [Shewanella sp. NIFS-20-20]MBV7315819.1 MotA/TolQ/ExbB proton channel family protein [Shewanella sp. NIFS-20-20]
MLVADLNLGVLTWPLVCCALVTLVIIIERLAFMLVNLRHRPQFFRQQLQQIIAVKVSSLAIDKLESCASRRQDMLARGSLILLHSKPHHRRDREALMTLWLAKEQRQLLFGIKVLQAIGVISPLLGLLGTVLGLIDMFAGLGQSAGPITPAMLSAGLGLAMNTTAAGLVIALPALTFSQIMNIWVVDTCRRTGHGLTELNLWLDGVHSKAGLTPDLAVYHGGAQ